MKRANHRDRYGCGQRMTDLGTEQVRLAATLRDAARANDVPAARRLTPLAHARSKGYDDITCLLESAVKGDR